VRGLLIGRFQPFHAGHLGLVRAIGPEAPDRELLIGIGSAEQSYTAENPFTAGERFEMIAAALRDAAVDGVTIVPIPDIRRHALWVRYVEGLLPKFDRVYTNNPLTRLLFERGGYAVESPPLIDRPRFEGAKIRARLAAGESVRELVPPAVDRLLRDLDAVGRLRAVLPAVAPSKGRRSA
jgi:nicotinamide-nucleotide adenylyltransferase